MNQKMKDNNHYIVFDWAIKHILRDKSNFNILEGLLTVLLDEKLTIEEILEDRDEEMNRKYNFEHVNIIAKNSIGEIVMVEIKLLECYCYLCRLLEYNKSKTISKKINKETQRSDAKIKYYINIAYFDIGEGDDYLYHGQNHLLGKNKGDELQLSEEDCFGIEMPQSMNSSQEYYILRLTSFEDEPKTPIEEWMEYLKNGRINPDTTVPGLQEAMQRLNVLDMTVKDNNVYINYLYEKTYEEDVLTTSYEKGYAKGLELARKMKAQGLSEEDIQRIIGMEP